MSRVVLVVVTWNSSRHLDTFFEHLPAGTAGLTDWQLVFADNASSDNTVEQVAERWPSAHVVQTGGNLGYSAAINRATQAHLRPEDTLVVLNPDVQLAPGCLATLLAATSPGVGICVPRHLRRDGSTERSLRRRPTLARAWAETLVGGRIGDRVGLSELVLDDETYTRSHDVDWASGAIMLITPECRSRVGGWDESFFLYSEEVDYCERTRRAGFTIRYVPEAEVVHEGGDYATDPVLWAYLVRNRAREYARRSSRIASALFRFALFTGEALRMFRGTLTPAVRRAGAVAALDRNDPGPRGTMP